MRYRFLGRTGLLVSELALGTNTFGGQEKWKAFGALDRAGVGEVLKTAVDAGINLLDLADSYGDGESEERVGEALQDLGVPRDQMILATKTVLRVGAAPNAAGASRAHLAHAVELSLRKLKTDYLDVLMLHNWDPKTPIEETMEGLDLLVKQGKVRYVGCSNFAAWQVAMARGVAEARRLAQLCCVEANYTVSGRTIERELIPLLNYQSIGLLVWGPLAAGLLTGKYDAEGKGPEGSRLMSGASTSANKEMALKAVAAIRPIAERLGASVGHVAIAWVLAKPVVSSVIVGCKSSEQLLDNLKAVDVALTPEDVAALDAVAPLPVEYPFNMQAAFAANRMPK